MYIKNCDIIKKRKERRNMGGKYTEAQKKATKKYLDGKTDLIQLRLKKGTKEQWQAMADEKGRSLTDFIKCCVEAVADDLIPLGPPRRMKEEKADNIIKLP